MYFIEILEQTKRYYVLVKAVILLELWALFAPAQSLRIAVVM